MRVIAITTWNLKRPVLNVGKIAQEELLLHRPGPLVPLRLHSNMIVLKQLYRPALYMYIIFLKLPIFREIFPHTTCSKS